MAIIRKIFVFGRFEPHQRQLARPAIIYAVFTVTGESSVRAGHSVVLAIFLAAILMQLSFGEENSRIVGTWRLVSYVAEVQATGEKLPVMGDKPNGYVTFLPGGRVFFMLTGEGRKPAKTDRERAELLDTLVAYTGTYSVGGDTWTTSVDVAWNPEWVGTKQVRSFKLEGDRLDILTPWRIMPNWSDKGTTRSIVSFERSK
ncbi:lipocalin-like domain-containing protein [Bradyrhizobium sp.]|uniref:lipocalin-like domain-containing protein n=1 Tax=Bradyrhizobium sp. TaxID=376 RepID=UPI0034216232